MKGLTSGGSPTKVIALGIGSGIDQSELQEIASTPHSRNVVVFQDFSDLVKVEEQLRDKTCSRKHAQFLIMKKTSSFLHLGLVQDLTELYRPKSTFHCLFEQENSIERVSAQ